MTYPGGVEMKMVLKDINNVNPWVKLTCNKDYEVTPDEPGRFRFFDDEGKERTASMSRFSKPTPVIDSVQTT